MVVLAPCSDGILSSPRGFSATFLSHFMADGAWCAFGSCSASGNVTVGWRRKRYRSSSGFLHHHLLGCYGLLAQLGFSFSNWLNRWAWLTSTSCVAVMYHRRGKTASPPDGVVSVEEQDIAGIVRGYPPPVGDLPICSREVPRVLFQTNEMPWCAVPGHWQVQQVYFWGRMKIIFFQPLRCLWMILLVPQPLPST